MGTAVDIRPLLLPYYWVDVTSISGFGPAAIARNEPVLTSSDGVCHVG